MRSQARFGLIRKALPPKRRNHPEHKLQCAVVQHLKLAAVPGCIGFAVPNGLVSDSVTVSRMKDAGLFPGVADLCIVLPSREVAFLELKAPGGRLSPDQESFAALCRRWDIKHEVASSLDDALSILCRWGAIQPSSIGRWPVVDASGRFRRVSDASAREAMVRG